MASKAFVLAYSNISPTYNDSLVVAATVSYVEFGNVITLDINATFLVSDTLNQMGTKIASAIRAATPASISAIPANGIYMPTYQKA